MMMAIQNVRKPIILDERRVCLVLIIEIIEVTLLLVIIISGFQLKSGLGDWN